MNLPKKKLLLLHGALGSQSHFDAVLPFLENDFDCHRLDFYGHGKESFANAFGIEAFAQQTKTYMEANDLDGCGVFGYSMGGYVALYLQSIHPGTFGRILTLGTKFNWNPESSAKEAGFLNPEVIREKVPKYAASLQALHGDKWEELCRQTATMMIALGDSPALNHEKLTEISIPVRIGLGDRDRMVCLEESNEAYRSLKQGSFVVMPETPHPLDQVGAERLAYEMRVFF